jgi:trans-aconitate 2-methyltransferase
MSGWDPDLYLKFGSERTQPAIDLASRIAVDRPRRVVDLGCGPGNSTQVLWQRWPEAAVVGVDSDPHMIAAARRTHPDVPWEQRDIAEWTAQVPYDVVYSNAALQWLPDHEALFPRLLKSVAKGGALAVQMPVVSESPVHLAMWQVARDPRWSDRLAGARNTLKMHPPAFYYDLLRPHAAHLVQWQTEYLHPLDGPKAIVDWVRSTALRPLLAALSTEEERASFEEQLLSRLTDAYPRLVDGRMLVSYWRQFMVASPA